MHQIDLQFVNQELDNTTEVEITNKLTQNERNANSRNQSNAPNWHQIDP